MTGIVIPDGGTIGSTSDTDALTITNTGVVKASQSIATSTIKDATGTNNSISIATNGEATFAENIIVGTAGKGIDFSNQTHSTSYTPSSEVLDHYEEGQFTATISSYTGSTAPVIHTQNTSGKSSNYTKIGNIICISVSIQIDFNSATTIDFSGLPFTVSSGGGGANIENSADSAIVSGIVAAMEGSSNFRYILTGANSAALRNVSFGFCYRTA